MDRTNSIYKQAIEVLMGLCPEDTSIKKIIDSKITQIALPILQEHAFDQTTLKQAVDIAAKLQLSPGESNFYVVMHACYDFSILVKEAKDLENHIFHVEAPPATSLEPIDDPLQANQAILRHMARPIVDVIKLAKVFAPAAVRNIIPLTPERLVLHNLTRRFVLQFSPKQEMSEELVHVIEPLSKRFIEEHPQFLQEIDQKRHALEKQAVTYLSTGQKHGLSSTFIKSIDKLKQQVSATEPDLDLVVSMRIADLVIEEYIKVLINNYAMEKTPELALHTPIPSQTKETRRTFMVNGGEASGKSSSLKYQKTKATQEGVDWKDVVMISRDAFKPMLLKPKEIDPSYAHFFASFAEDEAFLLRDAIMQEYRARIENDTAPHLYVDQVSPNVDMLLMAGSPEGKGLDLTIVQTPVENSFMMAYGRELETGYAQVTQGLLTSHSAVPNKLLTSLDEARSKGQTNIRLTIVANIARGIVEPIIHINFQIAQGTLFNRANLCAFFQKTAINLKALCFKEIYTHPPNSKAIDTMINSLTQDISMRLY